MARTLGIAEIGLDVNRKRIMRSAWINKFLAHGPQCHYCQVRLTLDTAVREHLTPLCRGGANTIENIVPSCFECNQMKAFRTEEEFLRDRPMLIARRTAARAKASPDSPVLSMEEANEPGLLKKLTLERDGGLTRHWWWRTA